MQGYKQNRSFIVAQSPIDSTVRDFWRMIFNQRCATIIMLCELVENNQVGFDSLVVHSHHIKFYLNFVKSQEVCAPYWCSGETVTYGDITVAVINEDQQDDYTRRVFQITDVKVDKTQNIIYYVHTYCITWKL